MSGRVYPLVLKEFNSASLTGLGTFDLFVDELEKPAFLVRITNASKGVVFLSLDGVITCDFISPEKVAALPFMASNRHAQTLYFPRGQRIWIAGAPSIGKIYCAAYSNTRGL